MDADLDRLGVGHLRSTLWRLGRVRRLVIEQPGDHLQLAGAVVVDARRKTCHRPVDGTTGRTV